MAEEPAGDSEPDEGNVLSPDDLDITAEDAVVEIDEGRYVISPSGEEPSVPPDTDGTDVPAPGADGPTAEAADLAADVVHEWLADRMASTDSKYGFDITARFEGDVSQRDLFSNDVLTTFENLVVWYANKAGSDTPVEDALGILLLESNLSVRFPAASLGAFARANGLDGSDSIAELLAAARESGGVRFPPVDD